MGGRQTACSFTRRRMGTGIGGYGHNVTKGGTAPEQDSPFAGHKRVTLPGVKPVEDGGELSNYTNHNS